MIRSQRCPLWPLPLPTGFILTVKSLSLSLSYTCWMCSGVSRTHQQQPILSNPSVRFVFGIKLSKLLQNTRSRTRSSEGTTPAPRALSNSSHCHAFSRLSSPLLSPVHNYDILSQPRFLFFIKLWLVWFNKRLKLVEWTPLQNILLSSAEFSSQTFVGWKCYGSIIYWHNSFFYYCSF